METHNLKNFQGKTDCGKFSTLIKMGKVPECLQLVMLSAIWWEMKGASVSVACEVTQRASKPVKHKQNVPLK